MSIKSSLFLLKIVFTYSVIASISLVDKGVLPLEQNSIGIRLYIDITNKDRQSICNLYSRCKKCCLVDSKGEDCDVMTVYGESIEVVKARDRKTLLYVAPMLEQHDLVGFCDFILNYNCNKIKDKINVKIPFDTQVGMKSSKALMEQYIGCKKVSSCDTPDEDSLNNCEPVYCDIKYFNKRPVFDHSLNKCLEAPICLTNSDKPLPDYVYVPNSNTCRNLDLPLTIQDIYAISSGLGTVTMSTATTFDMQVEVKSNCSTVSQNLNFLLDLMCGKLCPIAKGVVVDFSECFKSAILTIVICIISVCGILFILVCCVNTAVWFYMQWSVGNLRKTGKRLKNFFGRRKFKDTQREQVNSTIRNALLREVIIKDIPIELRNSAIEVCDRIGREVGNKKRYRVIDIGSRISLQGERDNLISSNSSSNILPNEKE